MSKPSMNLQDSYLNQVRKDGGEVKIIMLDGSELTGHVRGFDNFTVVLQCQNEQHLIYKHAMAHIVSKKPFKREMHEMSERPERPERPERREAPPRPRESSHEEQETRVQQQAAAPQPAQQKAPFNAIDFSKVKSGQ